MKRNILVYCNQPFPLSETFVYNQTMRLRRYTTFFVSAKLPKGPRIPIPLDRVCLLNRGGIDGWIQEATFKVFGRVPREVMDWVRSIKPVLLHAHFGPYGVIALPLARKLGLPLVVSFHGTDATKKDLYVWCSSYIAHRLYLLRRRSLARHACCVVAPSAFLRDLLINRHGIPEEKVVLIRHGVDLEEFRPLTKATEWGHILFVGRLIQRKGLHYLLQAFRHVKEKFPAVKLTIIGDGPMRSRYERMAERIIGNGVTFLGAQPHSVVREYMQRAYLFCMPSITMPSGETETLGMVLVEAMAMKVPPVSFQSGGIPEVVIHGETGFLAEERNIEQLVHYLTLLLEQPDLRNKLGEAGRQRVEEEFNLEKQNAKLEALYDELAAISSQT